MQVKDAKGREALLQSELKAMNGKASLLPNALSQAEKCNKQLIVNDKVLLLRAMECMVLCTAASLLSVAHYQVQEVGQAWHHSILWHGQVCKKQRQDLERALEQHTQAFEACAGLSKEVRSVPVSDIVLSNLEVTAKHL